MSALSSSIEHAPAPAPVVQLRIDEIAIGERARLDLGDIESLASEIRELGLLQPIMVERSASGYQLVFGARRLAAVKSLGWERISAFVREPQNRKRRTERAEN